MKLYEFTYTDNQNLTETEILRSLDDFLSSEAAMQGWARGYNLRQCKDIRQLADGQRQFTFEVLGEYIDSNSVDFDQEIQENTPPKTSIAAQDAPL
jgi:hypothetical protein